MRLGPFLACSALALLAACAGQTRFAGADGASAYGLFLAGQGADNHGDPAVAQSYYSAAKAAGAADLDDRLFMAALSSGDLTTAAKLAPKAPPPAAPSADGEDSGPTNATAVYQLGVIARAIERMSANDGKGAVALLTNEPTDLLRTASEQLRPWAQLMAGQKPDLKLRVSSAASLLANAHLAESAGQPDAALTDYQAMDENGLGALAAVDYGAFLERQGKADDALALYKRQLDATPGRRDLQTAQARVLAKGKPPAALTPRQGAAQVLFGEAALMGQAGADQLQIEFMRFGLALDPANDDAWLDLGDQLADGDEDGARAAYQHIAFSSPDGPSALARIASIQANAGDTDGAIKNAAKAAAATPPDQGAAVIYAAILADAKHYDQAIKIFDDLIAKSAAPDWRLYYQRWQVKEISGGEGSDTADLQAALAIAPNEATLLNALGYTWIDKNQNIDQAMTMIRKAAAAQPQNGEIADSLGWGYYRQGDFADAVAQLEKAVELEPAIPDINDHLGDAYWRTGRQVEARYQWQRALSLDPDPDLKAKVQAKLTAGLPAPPAGS